MKLALALELLTFGASFYAQEQLMALNHTKYLADLQGEKPAANLLNLGLIHFFGLDGEEVNYYLADVFFRAAAHKGETKAQEYTTLLRYFRVDFMGATLHAADPMRKKIQESILYSGLNEETYISATVKNPLSNAHLAITGQNMKNCGIIFAYMHNAVEGGEGKAMLGLYRSLPIYWLDEEALPQSPSMIEKILSRKDRSQREEAENLLFGKEGELRDPEAALELLVLCEEEDCQILLAQVLVFSEKVRDFPRALKIVLRIVTSENKKIRGAALALLGYFYTRGEGVAASPERAQALFEFSARLGDPNGQLNYAAFLFRRESQSVSLRLQSIISKLVEKAAKQNNWRAAWKHLTSFIIGQPVISCDFALRVFQVLVDKTLVTEIENLGLHFAKKGRWATSLSFYLQVLFLKKITGAVNVHSLLQRRVSATKMELLNSMQRYLHRHPAALESLLVNSNKDLQSLLREFMDGRLSFDSQRSVFVHARKIALELLREKDHPLGLIEDLKAKGKTKKPALLLRIHKRLSEKITAQPVVNVPYKREADFVLAEQLHLLSKQGLKVNQTEIQTAYERSFQNFPPRSRIYRLSFLRWKAEGFFHKIQEDIHALDRSLGHLLLAVPCVGAVSLLFSLLKSYLKSSLAA